MAEAEAVKDSCAIAEHYVLSAARAPADRYAVLMLAPWRGPQKPANVWALDEVRRVVAPLPQKSLAQLVRHGTLLVPCTFESEADRNSAARLVAQLEIYDDLFVVLLMLPEMECGQPSREVSQRLLARYEQLLGLGANSVILDPSSNPQELVSRIEQERIIFESESKRINMALVTYDQNVTQVREQHHQLLWESIPNLLMPKLVPIDYRMYEYEDWVGRFRKIRSIESTKDRMMLAEDPQADEDSGQVVIKTFEKKRHITSIELECIYREFRFLTDVLEHPNLVRCTDILHSVQRFHFVLNYAGQANLRQLLEVQQSQRLDAATATEYVRQVADALAYCHAQDVAHRQVCLEHVIIDEREVTPFCRLCDFFFAVHAREPSMSVTLCNDLPCIAPEVACRTPYRPRFVDLWSLGVVLLEAVGGLGALRRQVPWEDDSLLPDVAAAICQFFSEEGSHARALCGGGAQPDGRVLSRCQALLKPEPLERGSMESFLSI